MSDIPSVFESIAGICKFIAIPHIDENYYQTNFDAIEIANSFTRVLASNYHPLEIAFRQSLPLPTDEGGNLIDAAFKELDLNDAKIQWIDEQITIILKHLLPVVKSSELPKELEWVRHSIEGAFSQ